MSSLEYICLDAHYRPRAKTKCLPEKFTGEVGDLSAWNLDGSSTGQCTTEASELIIKPVYLCRDPFRGPDDYLVLCDTWNPDGTPHQTNHFVELGQVVKHYEKEEAWFGFEQEYIIYHRTPRGLPYRWKSAEDPGMGAQGPYYCSVGGEYNFGRPLAEKHREMCLKAGLKYCGLNAEVMPSQWEFQIGPCSGWDFACQLWLARYILYRLSEDVSILGEPVSISFDPKPTKGDWNGNGGHTNFSTQAIRKTGGPGREAIDRAIIRLEKQHFHHMKISGTGNRERMSGKHETADWNRFSAGVSDRSASIRIPTETDREGGGYLEDRRYAGNADPCLVARYLIETICSNEEEFKTISNERSEHLRVELEASQSGHREKVYEGGAEKYTD